MRIDTPQEAQYYANGGILQFVLRQLIASKPAPVHAYDKSESAGKGTTLVVPRIAGFSPEISLLS